MNFIPPIDIAWWIGVVEIPALAGLFWLVRHTQREGEAMLFQQRENLEAAIDLLRDSLAAYKLEVAKSYASIAYLKDVERRLTGHLLRIETKLDGVTTGARP